MSNIGTWTKSGRYLVGLDLGCFPRSCPQQSRSKVCEPFLRQLKWVQNVPFRFVPRKPTLTKALIPHQVNWSMALFFNVQVTVYLSHLCFDHSHCHNFTKRIRSNQSTNSATWNAWSVTLPAVLECLCWDLDPVAIPGHHDHLLCYTAEPILFGPQPCEGLSRNFKFCQASVVLAI